MLPLSPQIYHAHFLFTAKPFEAIIISSINRLRNQSTHCIDCCHDAFNKAITIFPTLTSAESSKGEETDHCHLLLSSGNEKSYSQCGWILDTNNKKASLLKDDTSKKGKSKCFKLHQSAVNHQVDDSKLKVSKAIISQYHNHPMEFIPMTVVVDLSTDMVANKTSDVFCGCGGHTAM